MTAKPKLRDIAKAISVHLNRQERAQSKDKNSPDHYGLYQAGAGVAGSGIRVSYVSYQGVSHLKRAEAIAFLEQLDAGSTERHYALVDRMRQPAREAKAEAWMAKRTRESIVRAAAIEVTQTERGVLDELVNSTMDVTPVAEWRHRIMSARMALERVLKEEEA